MDGPGERASFSETLVNVEDGIWYVALVLIVCLGIYATVRFRGIQFRSLREMVRVTFPKESREGALSSFHVFCISMGSRIGVGNITGPILAIMIGGPGSILWMWVFAVIGMATSFMETTVGQIYKEKKADGHYHGGAAYYVLKGLGKRRLAAIVAFIMIMMYVVGFVSMEVVSMSEAACGAFDFAGNNFVFAVLLTLIAAVVLAGGIQRVSKISVRVVPLMAVVWLLVCAFSILTSNEGFFHAAGSIFEYAFSVPAAVGGTIGGMLLIGMKRGVLSNEAGIGTIPNISSMAHVKHPAQQGYSQSLGVLIDVIISTMTALVILSYADIDTLAGMYNSGVESVPMLQAAFADTIGGIAPYAVAAFMFLFAFTCTISDFVIGSNNVVFIKDTKTTILLMKVLILAVIFLSSFFASDDLFAIVDIFLAICAFVNFYVMLRLGGRAVEAWRDYTRQRKEGVDTPVFHKSCLSDDTGVTEWD